jgi:hypothetical protein
MKIAYNGEWRLVSILHFSTKSSSTSTALRQRGISVVCLVGTMTFPARQIMELFFVFGSRHYFRPETNCASSDCSTFHKHCRDVFPTGSFSVIRNSITALFCNAHHWLTPIWSAAAEVLSVRNLYNFIHNCREPQIWITENLTFLALLLAKKKIRAITFWATLI